MEKLSRIGTSALITGSVASIFSTVVLAALARSEGRSAVQPTNATSHWLHGDKAAACRQSDMAHTGIGFATHHASAIFWALLFEAWLAHNPPHSLNELLRDAAAMSAIAAAVDYGVAPKRFTPGWELVVSKKSVFGAFAGLALGWAAGALASRALQSDRAR